MGGIAVPLGGLLWSAKTFSDKNHPPPWSTDITDALFFVMPRLFTVALVGL